MKKLFSAALEEGGVFANDEALLPDYAPAELLHRERELGEIARALSPATRGNAAQNLFFFGPTGTGKTSAVKHVLKELEEYSDKAKGIYVNCWTSNTRQGVFSDIAEGLGETLPRRGIGSGEIFSRIIQAAKRESKAILVVLDEADRIFEKKEESLLYDLCRGRENFGAKITVICISNNAEMLATADARIRSSLSPHSVEFRKYTPTELKDILRERAKTAFLPNACTEEAIALCAAHAAKIGGDARLALEALWNAGRNAQMRGSSKVEAQDARAAFEKEIGEWKKQARLSGATEDEQLALGILKEKGTLTSGELLEGFLQKKQITERGLRYVIESLESKKLVETRDTPGKEGRGKYSEITLV